MSGQETHADAPATFDVPCRACGRIVSLPRLPGRFGLNLKTTTCRDCIEAERQRREAQERQEAQARRRAALQAVRADLPGVLARCGVPLAWRESDFANMPDLPAGLVAKVRAWAAAPQGMFLLFGLPGSGKTWLAVAALRYVLAEGLFAPAAVRFIGERAYLDGLKSGFARDGAPVATRALPANDPRRVPLLAFDDLCSTRATDWTVGELAALVEDRYAQGLPTIFTSNVSPDALGAALDGRIVSRIAESRLMLQFPPRDLRTSGRLKATKHPPASGEWNPF
jgi:DNA replication protein DnaC